jgi:hypothetical protein
MKLNDFRDEIMLHNAEHPDLKQCIYYGCQNRIDPAWDNDVLCQEHNLLFTWWFYELDGHQYCPEIWDFNSGKKLPKPLGSDENMTAYRKRYCDWIASLDPAEYERILKHQIGDDA